LRGGGKLGKKDSKKSEKKNEWLAVNKYYNQLTIAGKIMLHQVNR
jgi:hypothetical protein